MKYPFLTKSCFDMYDVWFFEDMDESASNYISVSKPYPLPEDKGLLFIKAKFYLPKHKICNGYLTVDGYSILSSAYCYHFCIYIENDIISINLNMSNREIEDLIKFQFERMGMRRFQIFPLRYYTNHKFKNSEIISGFIDPFYEQNDTIFL